eukprot:1313126-Prymnesium_polylepis.2
MGGFRRTHTKRVTGSAATQPVFQGYGRRRSKPSQTKQLTEPGIQKLYWRHTRLGNERRVTKP